MSTETMGENGSLIVKVVIDKSFSMRRKFCV